MIVSLNEILQNATNRNVAIGAFNTPNLECITAVLNAAEAMNEPVIISHAEVHDPVAPLSVIGPVMVQAAQKAKVPVCLHLDHCETLSYMEEALKLGFTGVMYDGSALPYEENVKNTQIAVQMAKKYGANVEAEIGQLASREGGENANAAGPVYTDPDLAVRFCEQTKIDALAPSFGTAHGIYKAKPVLDFERVRTIAERTGLPLVMHGGSGVSDADYQKAISNGIRKINYYSYMSKAGTEAVKKMLEQMDVTYFHDLALAAQHAMEKNVIAAIKVFSAQK